MIAGRRSIETQSKVDDEEKSAFQRFDDGDDVDEERKS